MKFKPNPMFSSDYMRSRQAVPFLTELAGKVASSAGSSAPYRTGHLRGGIEVDVAREGGKTSARVTATDFKSGWYEFGTRRNRAHPFLRPAARAQGLDLEGGRGR